MRAIWLTFGLASLLTGALGAVLPVLPTTPLVILAAFCFGKSSPRLHSWLLGTRLFGPMIADWEAHGVIPKRVKWIACTMMALVLVVSIYAQAPIGVIIAQTIGIAIGASYVISRPSSPIKSQPPLSD